MKFNIVTENFVGYLKTLGAHGEIFGGAEIILYDLSKLLLQLGHDVTVVQYGQSNKEFEFEDIHVRQVKVPSFRALNKVGITRRFHGGGLFWKGHLDADVDRVHFHYYYLGFPHGNNSMTGFSHGIDWDCPWSKRSIRYRDVRDRFSFWMMRTITGSVLKRLNKIIANDTHFQHYVEVNFPEHTSKVVVIPNYVDISLFHPRTLADAYIQERFNGKIKILLPKMPAYERGTDIAIKAIARLTRGDVVLLVVGESAARPIFEKIARKFQVDDRVFFLGHRDHFNEMPGVYAACDIVIVPSPCREATALAVLEGMASGKPVIASNIGGIPDIVSTPDVAVLTNPSDQALAEALEALLANDELRASLGRGAWDHIGQHFTKELWETRMGAALEA